MRGPLSRLRENRHGHKGREGVALTAEQRKARERWRRHFNLPILLAAIVPLFVTNPDSTAVALAIGFGSWIIFVIDLVVQRRIVPEYFHTRNGRIDRRGRHDRSRGHDGYGRHDGNGRNNGDRR